MKKIKQKTKRKIVLAVCVLAAALVIVLIVQGVRGLFYKKADTSAGLEYIHGEEKGDIAAIEKKIELLEKKDGEEGAGERSLKEKFTGAVIVGDSITEGFTEYDILNTSSVVAKIGVHLDELDEQIKQVKKLSPGIIFLSLGMNDVEHTNGDADEFVKQYGAVVDELNKALLELKKITGISLEVSGAAPEQIEPALTQIHCLCTAYKEKYNRTDFLQGLMTGNIPHYEISDRASRLHIDPEEKRILFLIEGKHFDETSGAILKNLLSCRSKTYIVPLTETLLAVIRPLCQNETFEDMRHIAETIVDTLNTEALIRVRLSYSSVMNTLADIQKAFQETNLALKVGRLFYSEQNIFPYNELGIGRLIYRLPVSLCENFLSEIFGSPIPKTLDPELMATVNRFFLNNLNIAETARQLHMHRNTLIYRLEQIEKQTGLDLRLFDDAMTFKIAMMVINYLKGNK